MPQPDEGGQIPGTAQEGQIMGKVITAAAVSVDGFIAPTTRAAWARCSTGTTSAVPVVFGSGRRFFGSYEGGQLMLEDPRIVQGDRVSHVVYAVRRN